MRVFSIHTRKYKPVQTEDVSTLYCCCQNNDTFGEELEADLLAEGEKLGPVEKITVFAKNNKGPVVIKVSLCLTAQPSCPAGRVQKGGQYDFVGWRTQTSLKHGGSIIVASRCVNVVRRARLRYTTEVFCPHAAERERNRKAARSDALRHGKSMVAPNQLVLRSAAFPKRLVKAEVVRFQGSVVIELTREVRRRLLNHTSLASALVFLARVVG